MDSYRGNPDNPVLLYHILPTRMDSEHFEANTIVETRNPGSVLRINRYSNGVSDSGFIYASNYCNGWESNDCNKNCNNT